MRREVLEYIVRGFEKNVFKNDYEEKKDSFMKHIHDNDAILKASVKEHRPSLFARLFCFCFTKADEFQENYEAERKNMLMGHPDVMRRIPMMTLQQVEAE